MFKIIKSNPLFFIAFLIFVIIGGVLLMNMEQGAAILFFSEHRSGFGDVFFRYFTKLGEEPIYIFFISLFLFIRYRYALLILLCGMVSLGISAVLKIYFAHPRPAVFFKSNGLLDEINLVKDFGIEHLYSGMTSFPSGHTMSAFSVFAMVAFLFSKKKYLGLLMFCFALGVGISRIYLVQHFLEDVYLGAILGIGVAMILFLIQNHYAINENKLIDKSLKSKDRA